MLPVLLWAVSPLVLVVLPCKKGKKHFKTQENVVVKPQKKFQEWF